MKTKLIKNEGITLIALVITIIVLLILATVSIAMLTGENGILTQANKAKTETEIAEAKERAQMAIIAWQAEQMEKNQNSDLDLDDEIIRNILNEAKEKGHGDYIGKINNSSFTTSKGNYEIPYSELYQNLGKTTTATAATVAEAKKEGLPYGKNTEIQDNYGNIVKVPEGFKIAPDSADNVTGGVVIQDVNHGATAGSEFVWIPVGEVIKEDKTKVTISLGRYDFDSVTGKEKPYSESNTEDTAEKHNPEYKNIIAKDIEDFKTKASKGYYIGRYEARTASERKSQTDELKQLTIKAEQYVYNYVTQEKAAELSRNMYDTSKPFTSDLMNSYAWDTATVFLQTFDNRADNKKEKPYSYQNSLNTTLAPQGSNNLTEETQQDKICNIWDMASNINEWSTETHSKVHIPCAGRGGYYTNQYVYTIFRGTYSTITGNDYDGFRVILYL